MTPPKALIGHTITLDTPDGPHRGTLVNVGRRSAWLFAGHTDDFVDFARITGCHDEGVPS